MVNSFLVFLSSRWISAIVQFIIIIIIITVKDSGKVPYNFVGRECLLRNTLILWHRQMRFGAQILASLQLPGTHLLLGG